jgi:hypothetical protein
VSVTCCHRTVVRSVSIFGVPDGYLILVVAKSFVFALEPIFYLRCVDRSNFLAKSKNNWNCESTKSDVSYLKGKEDASAIQNHAKQLPRTSRYVSCDQYAEIEAFRPRICGTKCLVVYASYEANHMHSVALGARGRGDCWKAAMNTAGMERMTVKIMG